MDSVEQPVTAAPAICRGCAKAIEPDSKFCPYCRASQAERPFPMATPPPQPAAASVSTSEPKAFYSDSGNSGDAYLVLRASSNIWDSTEDEDEPKPGQRRPLLVIDEQTVHLSHTDQSISPYKLLERIERIIEANEVPVQVALLQTRWQNDTSEVRPRIVASLKNHLYSDVKTILGVDYMGRWASIKMYLAVEPPIIPVPPPIPIASFNPPAVDTPMSITVIVLFALAAIALVSGFVMPPLLILAGILGWFAYTTNKQAIDGARARHQQTVDQLRRDHERQVRDHESKVLRERSEVEALARAKTMFRTYKIDDMRLFSSAMNVVFRAVIDDIVSTDGGKVERVEGGKGGYLNEDGVTQLAPAPRQTDVAQDFDL